MKFITFGHSDDPVILLLHGGGLSWWSLEPIAKSLAGRFHVVTPVIDGHGEDGETTFLSIEDSANKVLAYIDEQCHGKVYALGGLSIGAQIALEALSRRPDIANHAILEGTLVCPIPGTKTWMVPMIRLSYGLIRYKWFSRLQAKTLLVPEPLFLRYYEDSKKMSRLSLLNITVSNGSYALKSGIGYTTAKVLILVGEKEPGIMRKSAKLLHERIPGSQLLLCKGMGHGELSLAHPEQYLKTMTAFLGNEGGES